MAIFLHSVNPSKLSCILVFSKGVIERLCHNFVHCINEQCLILVHIVIHFDSINKSEAEHNITYKSVSARSEGSDQPAHPRSLSILLARHSVASLGSSVFKRTAKTGQTSRMHRLSCAFAGRTCTLVGNAVPRLISYRRRGTRYCTSKLRVQIKVFQENVQIQTIFN